MHNFLALYEILIQLYTALKALKIKSAWILEVTESGTKPSYF